MRAFDDAACRRKRRARRAHLFVPRPRLGRALATVYCDRAAGARKRGLANRNRRRVRDTAVEAGSEWQAEITDTWDGWFSLDMGIDVEGERVPLLPILIRLLERG